MTLPVVSGRPRSPAEALFEANGALVPALVSRRFAGLPPPQRDDALAAGRAGLWHACQRFDPARGFAFSSYATRCIQGYVLRELRTARRLCPAPVASLDAPLGDGGLTLADLLADESDLFAPVRDAAAFEARIAGCSARQREVLRALCGGEGRTHGEVGDEIGVTRAAVCNIVKQAARRLPAPAPPGD